MQRYVAFSFMVKAKVKISLGKTVSFILLKCVHHETSIPLIKVYRIHSHIPFSLKKCS